MKKLILIGAGGHAKSVADSINKSEYELCGFIDSNKKVCIWDYQSWVRDLKIFQIVKNIVILFLLEMLDTVSYGLTELENED